LLYYKIVTPELSDLLLHLLIALGLGLLLGLEREYAKRVIDKEEQFAGVRSYAFIVLFGFFCAYLSVGYGPWVYITGLAGLIALVIATYVMSAKSGSYGITTELSGILAFIIGALVFKGEVLLAVVATIVITSLLSLKVKLHSFIATLTPQEIRAFIQFTIISAVVLPFLPDEPFGPGGVWNLHGIWTMVVLVTGISFAGYLLAKILGAGKSSFLVGMVGGLVSSTALTLSFARRSRQHPGGKNLVAAVGIIAATATLYPRILLETWAVNRPLALQLALPIAFITVVAFGMAYLIHRKPDPKAVVVVPLTNPLNFAVALQFGAIYMAVQWLMQLVSAHYSAQGLYAGSLVFGATDMDAITLSIARTTLGPETLQGVTAILLATLSNTVMKFLIVVVVGDKSLRKWVGLGFGAIAIATILGLFAMRLVQKY
jgi:uncharacterized membrane protein (DUF4010 family)